MTDKKKVIIDCDPGIDDALALMLAAVSPELDILGITIVSGNTRARQCAQNALQVLVLMGRRDIPVYLGAERPLKREPLDAEDTHGADGLGGCARPLTAQAGFQEGAVQFILSQLSCQEAVDVIAIGPLTNIAHCLQKDPAATRRMASLTVMGGTYRSPGNCSSVAEFNFWADPHAAEIVFHELQRPITMVGLDVTRQVVFTPNYIELVRQIGGEVADFLVAMLQCYSDFHWQAEKILGSIVNDPLAVAWYLDHSLCSGVEAQVDIITEGKAIGMSIVDESCKLNHKSNHLVLTRVDTQRFFCFLLTRLFPNAADDICEIINNKRYGVGQSL